jgi:hypothetical protein
VTVETNGSVNTDTIGTYTLNYTATDKAGNTAMVSRRVYVVGKIDPRGLKKLAIAVISTEGYEAHIKALKQDFNTVIKSDTDQWARYQTSLSFQTKMLIDLGGGFKDSAQSHQYNPYSMHHLASVQDTGYLHFTFKDGQGAVLHTFTFDKNNGKNSGYIEVDGVRHNLSDAQYQASLHGYLLIENGDLIFDSEYRLSATGNKETGLTGRVWHLENFAKITQVELSLGTKSTDTTGYSQLPVVIFYDRQQRVINRTFSGGDNNLIDRAMGSVGRRLKRVTFVDYGDFISSLAGANRPNPRTISNLVSAQLGSMPNAYQVSDFVWVWGQFLDHDIDLTEGADPVESADIVVPTGDDDFDPDGTGRVVIPFHRSKYDTRTGFSTHNPRQQINQISAWVDASNVYGSNIERANALRTLDGTGKLKTSAGNLLPFNTEGYPNAGGPGSNLFLAGDIRANEQASLTSLHTLFMREHNRLAGLIAIQYPTLSGEEIYQKARKLVGAEMQIISYQEYLPALLGKEALKSYSGYQPAVDGSISNIFSGASYRYGHSALNPTILRLDAEGKTIAAGHLSLRSAFFSPKVLVDEGGIAPILRGLAAQVCQSIDSIIIDDVRNFLFGQPGSGGFDLVTLNIQRGRDHGLPSYNDAREALGLARKTSFDEVTTNDIMRKRLINAYTSVDDIDVWVGGLSEDPVEDALVGELIRTVLIQQFEALRDGDRFWYQYDLLFDELAMVEGIRLADIIRYNTEIDQEIADNVFKISAKDIHLVGAYHFNDHLTLSANMTIDTNNSGFVEIIEGNLNLNGHTLTIKGDLIQSGGTLTLNGGQLIVTGDYRIQTPPSNSGGAYTYSDGMLRMLNVEDRVIIGGDFVTDSVFDHVGYLVAGIMTLKGNFTQKSTYGVSYFGDENFQATGSHRVVLAGDTQQVVSFEDAANGRSHFHILEITNKDNIVFKNAVMVMFLFDHKNNAFDVRALAASSFPDYDHDNIEDHLDNNPMEAGVLSDRDGDGVADDLDAFPDDPKESVDTDSDGIGNNADLDDDNDGWSDLFELANGYDPLDKRDGEAYFRRERARKVIPVILLLLQEDKEVKRIAK